MSILTQIKKRRSYPIDINGDKVSIRALTLGELSTLDSLPLDLKPGFVIGSALLQEDGSREFVPNEGEPPSDFSRRVTEACQDVPSDTIRLISEMANKLNHTVPTLENLRKN